ncbi:MAG: flagellar hook-basal body complex protein [Deltaproteobacteria bacterium]|nr:flagellar hook-basal body complex protein [Deltaproteobacteria bacterium]
MLRSFYSGISGLRNHQQSMDVLGNNIANVNTVGFKASRVSFTDTLSQTISGGREGGATSGGQNPTQIGLGMTVSSVSRNFSQGPLQTTGNALDLAIQGSGFFIVGQGDSFFYTRSGVFGVDNENQLVTDSGDLIYGWVDTNQDGVVDPSTDEMSWINLDRRSDGTITNVRSSVTPAVAGPNRGDATMGTITTGNSTISDEWRVEVVDATTGEYRVVGEKSGVLINEATGLATTHVGETFENVKLGSFVVNGGTAEQASLNIEYGVGNSIDIVANDYGAGGNDLKVEFVNRGKNQSLGVTFDGTTITVNLGTDADGFVTSTYQEVVDAINALSGTPVTATLNGTDATAEVLSPRFLQAGAGPNTGDYFTFTSTAPGGASIQTLTVAEDGTILGIFENGTTEELARIALGVVPNPEGLLAIGSGKFAESPTSGSGFPPRVAGTGGTGSIASGFLEMSNVDLTQEFTDMIVVQRGFQANSRIITTSDEMLQDLLALKR